VIAAASDPPSSSHSVSRPPHDAVDRETLEHGDLLADANRLASARLDEDVVSRLPRNGPQHPRPTVPLPVSKQQHLRRERRIAVDREELRRQRHAALDGAVGADHGVAALDPHVGVDVHEPIALALRLERDRREVSLGAQRGGQLDTSAAIGEVEIGRQLDSVRLRAAGVSARQVRLRAAGASARQVRLRAAGVSARQVRLRAAGASARQVRLRAAGASARPLAVRRHLIAFVADRLLDVVEAQGAAFNRRRGRLTEGQ